MSDTPAKSGCIEFDCDDCGFHVYEFGNRGHIPDPPLCASCAWMRKYVPDQIERDKLRTLLTGWTEDERD